MHCVTTCVDKFCVFNMQLPATLLHSGKRSSFGSRRGSKTEKTPTDGERRGSRLLSALRLSASKRSTSEQPGDSARRASRLLSAVRLNASQRSISDPPTFGSHPDDTRRRSSSLTDMPGSDPPEFGAHPGDSERRASRLSSAARSNASRRSMSDPPPFGSTPRKSTSRKSTSKTPKSSTGQC